MRVALQDYVNDNMTSIIYLSCSDQTHIKELGHVFCRIEFFGKIVRRQDNFLEDLAFHV